MSAKTSQRRKQAFFQALAETGNQTISAERARVSRSWVTLHRSTDPAFKAEMEAAIAAARERLSGSDATRPDRKWSNIDGEELVIRGSNGRRAQISRARLKQFTPRVEVTFLRTLAASCNVKAACAAAGMTAAAAYVHRRKWRSFAERWDEALFIGYRQLEMAMLENGSNMLERAPVDADAPIPPMSVDQVIHILHMHQHSQRGIGKAPGLPRHRRSPEEIRASIVRKLDIIERADAMKDEPLPDFMKK